MIVGVVIQKWYANVMPVMSWAQSGLEGDTVGKYTSLFYADDGAVGSQDLDWLQDVNQHLYYLSHSCIVDFKPNKKKTEVMICRPGAIRGHLSNAGYKCCHDEVTSDSHNKRRCTLVQCTVCNKDLTYSKILASPYA